MSKCLCFLDWIGIHFWVRNFGKENFCSNSEFSTQTHELRKKFLGHDIKTQSITDILKIISDLKFYINWNLYDLIIRWCHSHSHISFVLFLKQHARKVDAWQLQFQLMNKNNIRLEDFSYLLLFFSRRGLFFCVFLRHFHSDPFSATSTLVSLTCLTYSLLRSGIVCTHYVRLARTLEKRPINTSDPSEWFA